VADNQREVRYPRRRGRGAGWFSVFVRARLRSFELSSDLRREVAPKLRVCFHKAHDVGEILLSFALPSCFVRVRPDFAPENIFETRNSHLIPENFATLGTRDEVLIAWVGLQLDTEIRSRNGEIDAMFKFLHLHPYVLCGLAHSVDSIRDNDEIQIKAHHRLRVRIDREPSDYAIGGPGLLQQR